MRAPAHPRALLLALCLLGTISPGLRAMEPAADRRPLLVTVDDLPIAGGALHPDPAERRRLTRQLLAVLARHHVHAVGLVIASHAESAEDRQMLLDWLAAGHELGNHSYGHLDYTRQAAADYIQDVEKGRLILGAILAERGAHCRFFRFPMLREGDTEPKLRAMRAYLDGSGQRNLPVTIDNQDWSFEAGYLDAVRRKDRDQERLIAADYQAALRAAVRHHEAHGDELFGRAVPQILLLHANAIGAAQWDELFGWLEATGHRFATVDEVMADEAFSEPQAFVGRYGVGLWDRIEHERETATVRADLEALLREQSDAWNRGDLEAFCSVYADDATFSSPSGLTRGREAVLERYRKRYPDSAAMGRLTLDIDVFEPVWGMEVDMAGDAVPGSIHGASIAARWTLAYTDRPAATGRTLLVLHQTRSGWVIVQDASM